MLCAIQKAMFVGKCVGLLGETSVTSQARDQLLLVWWTQFMRPCNSHKFLSLAS